jgi:hypothetical protein
LEGLSGMTDDTIDYLGYGMVYYSKDIIDNADESKKAIAKAPDLSALESSGITIEWRHIIKHEQGIIVIGVYTDNGASYAEADYYLFDSHNSDATFTNVTPDLAEYVGKGLFYYTEDNFNDVSSVWSSVASEPEYSAPNGKYIEWGSAFAYDGKLVVVGRYVEGSKPAFPNAIKVPSDSSVVYEDTEVTEEISDEIVDEEIVPEECEHVWTYHSNNNGTHLQVCTICDEVIEEKCELDAKGICKLCGYSKVQTEFASISELKKANLKAGDKVSTLGYYTKNDGGGSAYLITKSTKLTSDDGVCVRLNNGLYAVIEDTSLVSVKNYGIRGDGSKEDFSRLQAVISKGFSKVYFPSGTYNFDGSILTLDNKSILIGEGKDKTTIKNLGIDAKNGIELENICFDGGANFTISGAGGLQYKLTGVVTMHPANDTTEVVYKNCIFKNMGFASSVTSRKGHLKSDYVTGCEFYNIGRIAIHHSINIGKSVYTDNIFDGIGSSELLSGPVAAIWLGDLTNNTYTESDDAYIANNTLKNLYTGDDPYAGNHNINANLLAVSANKATITGNNISDVHGFGEDREGVYTKVADLTITGNTLTNAGFGEGYITCKGHSGYTYSKITDNTISGTYGSGIYTYGAALISNNRLNITNCRFAIVCFRKEQQVNDNVTISDNQINCNPGYYYYDGQIVDTFKPGTLIRVELVNTDIFFQHNKINSNADSATLTYGLRILGVKGDITISDNDINIDANNCGAIGISGNEEFSPQNQDSRITVTNNNIRSSYIGIQAIFKNQSGITPNRQYSIENNVVKGVEKSKYGVFVDGGAGNNDSLNYVTDTKDTTNVSKAYARIATLTTNYPKQITQQAP